MKKIICSLLLGTGVIAISSCGDGNNSTTTTKDSTTTNLNRMDTSAGGNTMGRDSSNTKSDGMFAIDAAEGGMMEVQFGKLAQTKSMNSEIKDLGKMMEKDHSKAGDELKGVATKKNISVPTALSDKHQRDYEDLSKKSGADFDKAYTDMMVNDHKEDIDKFQHEADKGNDPDLKSWANGKLPTLHHHLEMAQMCYDNVRKNNKK